jgi:hypothetical protein
MAECELLKTCPFFNDRVAEMPTVAAWLKKQYCRNNYSECARYKVRNALGVERVPRDLFPNEPKRAQKIIESG